MSLPTPTRDRWQPLRAGLVDLFHYDQQEFRFRDGRLLLRGNNGTGKSKVLALTLPFLLDGRMTPSRVEPDGDTKKRMEWNLLLGGEHPHDERVGYSWLELGRIDDGRERYVTLGCGMKAVRGRSTVTQWLFITEDRRVCDDLHLVDEDAVPLTRERLEQALGPDGRVFYPESGTDGSHGARYRRAVDELLFGLGSRRYEALLELLIRIRQPQLSRQPSEAVLSKALTDALTPLAPDLLADIADAFRELESDRERLRAADEARRAASAYLDVYRRYARLAARRRAGAPRRAQAEVDRINRDTVARATERDDARKRVADADAELEDIARAEDDARARERALDASAAADDEKQLVRAHERTRECEEELATAQRAHEDSRSEQSRLTTDLNEAVAAEQTAAAAVEHRSSVVREHAEAARLASVATLLGAPDAQRRIATAIDGHARGLEVAREHATRHEQARAALRGAETTLAERQDEHVAALAARDSTDEALAGAAASHVAGVRSAVARWEFLRLPDADGVFDALADWAVTLDGRHPVEAAARELGSVAMEEEAAARAAIEQEIAGVEAELAAVVARVAELERGEHDEPAAPVTRAAGTRAELLGAPLWRLVDFYERLSPDERAGLEGALEASGMLDAWVTPDGALEHDGIDGDTWIDWSPTATATDGVGLAAMLVPAAELPGGVSADVVQAILLRIDTMSATRRPSASAIATTGRYRQGLLTGGFRPPRARYIGREAREAARLEALELARHEEAVLRERQTSLLDERAASGRRRATIADERDQRFHDDELRGAHDAVTRATALATKATENLGLAERAFEQRGAEASTTLRMLKEVGADLGLPTGLEEIAATARALAELREALAALWPTLDGRRQASSRREAVTAAVERATTRSATRGEDLRARTSRLIEAKGFLEELERSVGQEILALQRRRDELALTLKELAAGRRKAQDRRETALKHEATAEGARVVLADDLVRASDEREKAATAMRRFAASGVLTIGLPEIEIPDDIDGWSVTTAVAVARRIEQIVSENAGEEAWRRAVRAVTEELSSLGDALSLSGDHASYRPDGDDTIAIDVRFRGRPLTVDSLAAELDEDVEARRRLLDEREREIIENHLIDEVAVDLHGRITDAEEQVRNMNAELAARPTSTGMQLRLRWVTDSEGPVGLNAARRRLLRQTSAAWSADDRAAVGAFLQAQLQAVRDADPSLPWVEQLSRAFDYRAWHRFVIERRQGSSWVTATGPASGGERVLAATIPLFAAASAHYRSATRDEAPRPVLLDEVFAGVDDDSRAKSLGLLAAFDLDVVMTSEREWGCYPEVPGLSIAQLSRVADIPAVLVTHWEWDGRTLTPETRS